MKYFIKAINYILKPFGAQINRSVSVSNEKVYLENKIKRLSKFYCDWNSLNNSSLNKEISAIVFSKDRAMQLHALLSSYFFYTKNPASLFVLFTCSNEKHKQSYEVLQQEFQSFPVSFLFETDFANQVKKMINQLRADRIFFMTDDGIFLDHYDLSDCLSFNPLNNIFSLRLGSDFDFCYTHDQIQMVPQSVARDKSTNHLNSWVWQDMAGSPDWIYPLSVDANIFLKKEIELMLDHISFKSPNSLESQMQLYNDLFIPRNGICYSKVKYVNVPCNIVQTDFDNISTGTFSIKELVEKFLNGQRINWKMLEKYNARDAQTVKFSFVEQRTNDKTISN